MGHTHYNELAHDGRIAYMATRSTGQVEEGPVGASIAAVDGDAVSWRFKPLDRFFPFVLVTSPADRRLARSAAPVAGRTVRARVLGDADLIAVDMRSNDGAWTGMARAAHDPTLWEAALPGAARSVAVRARDARGRTDIDTIEPPSADHPPPPRHADGSDRDRIGAWPEKDIPGTQLGPNRRGRKW